jgi:hypothetical protein
LLRLDGAEVELVDDVEEEEDEVAFGKLGSAE